MRRLSAADITNLCEWGFDKHDLDRAIALLRLTEPGAAPESLARLSIGRRDARLLKLRAIHFGESFEMRVLCPKCEAALEFSMEMSQLIQDEPDATDGTLAFDGGRVHYRLPDSTDMASISHIEDPVLSRQALLGRCIDVVDEDGKSIHPSEVSTAVLDAVISRWAEEDPQADITFKLKCAACNHGWRTVFDILSYFWLELETFDRRIQDEVHQIASHYGWAEEKILRMTADRRKRYIELIGG